MIKPNLPIRFLRYVLKNGGTKWFAETRPILLDEFPEEPDFGERKKMRYFIKLLKNDDYIETEKQFGIGIVREGGEDITRDQISVTARLKPKGYQLIEDHKNRKNNLRLTIFSIIVSAVALILGFTTSNKDGKIDELQIKLKESQTIIDELQNQLHNLQIQELNKNANNSNPTHTAQTKQNDLKTNQ